MPSSGGTNGTGLSGGLPSAQAIGSAASGLQSEPHVLNYHPSRIDPTSLPVFRAAALRIGLNALGPSIP